MFALRPQYPQYADLTGWDPRGSFVPGGVLSRCSNVREQSLGYPITSSARLRSVGGTVRRSALAVFILITRCPRRGALIVL